MSDKYLAELRDMRAFSANDSQKPALDWAIRRLDGGGVEGLSRDDVNALIQYGACHEASSHDQISIYVAARDRLLQALANKQAPDPTP